MNVLDTEKLHIFSFCSVIEEEALIQIKACANHPAARLYCSLMPDAHSGYGMPIGGVVALEKALSPFMVGSDIACGMLFYETGLKLPANEFKDLFPGILHEIDATIPMGTNRNTNSTEYIPIIVKLLLKLPDDIFTTAPKEIAQELLCVNLAHQMGTLGGGNHFIEFQKNQKNELCVMIHSGSRHLGKTICDIYHKIALQFNEKYYSPIPNKFLAFLPEDSKAGQHYIKLMRLCMDFSFQNRMEMLKKVLIILKKHTNSNILNSLNVLSLINIHHNFASKEKIKGKELWIHRKGATPAYANTLGIVPGSMGTSSFIVEGKSNPLSLFSCSHGAGRAMSHSQANKTITKEQMKISMSGIVHLSNLSIDEAPTAYKDIHSVMKEQEDLVSIKDILTPLAVIKASSNKNKKSNEENRNN